MKTPASARSGLSQPQSARWLGALLVLVLLAAAADAWQAWRKARINAQAAAVLAADAASPASAAESPIPALQFAHAQALTAALGAAPAGGASSTETEAALRAWRRLHEDPQLGAAARFNAANLLLRQAQAVLAGSDANRVGVALPLIELAKEQYRALLRENPGLWAARYNLERAQRLQPDPEEGEESAPSAPSESERAPTTMRGQALGLP